MITSRCFEIGYFFLLWRETKSIQVLQVLVFLVACFLFCRKRSLPCGILISSEKLFVLFSLMKLKPPGKTVLLNYHPKQFVVSRVLEILSRCKECKHMF